MNRRICVVSLYFNPSYTLHVAAFGRAFKEIGYDVQFVLDHGYKSFYDFRRIAPVAFYNELSSKQVDGFAFALFCNAAISNPFFARRLKHTGCKVMYLYHEPSVPRKTLSKSELYPIARLAFSRIFSYMLLRKSDLILLPSEEALRNYVTNDVKYNDQTAVMPLIFDDGYVGLENTPRTTFSYIGTISYAHAFDEFIAFMKYALRRELSIRFLVASRHEFPWDKTLEQYKDSITVRCGRPLTVREINESYAQSLCVWNLYRYTTQSGVMANAFMCGTPVIASRTGAFADFVMDGYNGEFSDAANHEEIAAAYRKIVGSFEHYSINSRQTFLENFCYRSQLPKIGEILRQHARQSNFHTDRRRTDIVCSK